MALYDKIGVGYDSTRSADPYLLSRLIHHLRVKPGARCLDVGSGTGNYSIAMRSAGLAIYGVEISATMLATACEKSREVRWHNGDVLALPFRDGVFAGATMTFVHHHVKDPIAGFREIRRVLAADSRLVLLNCTLEQFRHYWLAEYFPRAMEQAGAPYVRFDTSKALEAAGFKVVATEQYDVADDLKDWFMYCGKRKPEVYLNPRVRAGISFFAAAQDQEEIDRGLARIEDDIRSGQIEEVMRRYAWDGGDYMFTIAAK